MTKQPPLVWLVECRESGDMLAPLYVRAVVTNATAGRRIAEERLHSLVKKRRVWRRDQRGPGGGDWTMYWNRTRGASVIAKVSARQVCA